MCDLPKKVLKSNRPVTDRLPLNFMISAAHFLLHCPPNVLTCFYSPDIYLYWLCNFSYSYSVISFGFYFSSNGSMTSRDLWRRCIVFDYEISIELLLITLQNAKHLGKMPLDVIVFAIVCWLSTCALDFRCPCWLQWHNICLRANS